MATLVPGHHRNKGKLPRRIDFALPRDGTLGKRRRSVRLGKIALRPAGTILDRVEQVLEDRAVGRPHSPELMAWIRGLPVQLHHRFVKSGLLHHARSLMTLGALLTRIFEQMDCKDQTKVSYGHARRNLEQFFGADKLVRDITLADADAFRSHLVKVHGLATATISRRIGTCRQFWKRALKWKMVDENVFAEVKTGSQKNTKRMTFVEWETINRIIEACPDWDWKLLALLGRGLGLRITSEVVNLKWSDIDWDKGTVLIHSPKTEHHEGGESRVCPLFEEVGPLLLEAFHEAPSGSVYVIADPDKRSLKPKNLRTHFERIIKRAGIAIFPKPFQNLRSSRETELAAIKPIQDVAKWMGNTPAVAMNHYLQAKQDTFQSVAWTREKAQRKAQQLGSEAGGMPLQPSATGIAGSQANAGDFRPLPAHAGQCGKLQNQPVGAIGFEPMKA